MNDGIYFDLPEDDYHAINRISASGVKKLRVSAATFWADSWLNPNPKVLTPEQEERKQLARVLGRAYHCARLEPAEFVVRYCRKLDKADYNDRKGFIAGGTNYGKALAELGQTKTKAGESVAQQAQRLKDAGYEGPIWDVELAEWETRQNGRIALPAISWDEIAIDMGRIDSVPAVHELLTGGAPEVSILWTCPETGLPMKTRLDYLKPRSWADFKTYANSNGKNVQQAILDSFRFNGYHLQAVIQRDALLAVKAGLKVQAGSDEQRALIAELQADFAEPDCHYIWQEKGGIPNLFEKKLRFFDIPLDTQINDAGSDDDTLAKVHAHRRTATAWHKRAAGEVLAAKREFMTYSQVYSPGDDWLPFNPSGEITDADFSGFWLDEAI